MDQYRQLGRNVDRSVNTSLLTINATRNVLIIYVLLGFLGFPGDLAKVIGGGPAKLLEYASWGIQFVLIMLSSGDDVMNIKLLNFHPAFRVFYLFFLYMCADSLLVSYDKKAVLITLIHMYLTIMFALWMVDQFDSETMLELFYYAQLIYLALCLVGFVAFRGVVLYNYEGSTTFRGLLGTKNVAATQLSLGILIQFILLLFKLRRGERISLVFLGAILLQFAFMLMSRAAGAILITVGYTAYILYYGMSKNKVILPVGLLFVIIAVGFLFFALTVLQALAPLLESIGKDASLTGRVPIWEQLLGVMQESHTMTGYGLEMFWRTPEAMKLFRQGLNPFGWAYNHCENAHNTIMEIWLNLGLIGVVFYFYMFICGDKGLRYIKEEEYLFCSAYMVMFTIRALTERQTAPASVYVFVSYVVLAMLYQAKYKHKLALQKQATIYKDIPPVQEEPEDYTWEGAGTDLAAFQARFSNQSGKRNSKEAQTQAWDVEEKEYDGNWLEKLLEEFDDNY